MWLIKVDGHELKEFVDPPPFVILSHRWTSDEVCFQDFSSREPRKLREEAKNKSGFAKITNTCAIASQKGLDYVWIDTCCIDKTSSAELTEAINSMFRWYKMSEICVAFLADLSAEEKHQQSTTAQGTKSIPGLESCDWFTRGWTLQELIAPERMEFFDGTWSLRFSKESAASQLSLRTRVPVEILRHEAQLEDIPVAVRMSWAADRCTTRIEDLAYCLLGIFNINMPMLYGEGDRAFLRLQEEIVKVDDDLTVFAWRPQDEQHYRGFFANSPREFEHCSSLLRPPAVLQNHGDVSVTNKGILISTTLCFDSRNGYHIPLGGARYATCSVCKTRHDVILQLRKTAKGYVRVSSQTCWIPEPVEERHSIGQAPFYARKHVSPQVSKRLEATEELSIKLEPLGFDVIEGITPGPGLMPLEFGYIHPQSHFDQIRCGFLGDCFEDDFFGLIELRILVSSQDPVPIGIAVFVLVYKLKDKPVDVRLCTHDDQHWKILEGRPPNWIARPEYNYYSILDTYRRERENCGSILTRRVQVERQGMPWYKLTYECDIEEASRTVVLRQTRSDRTGL